MSETFNEVQKITADIVAKKQDAAKLNYPYIIGKIKAQAGLGLSECTLSVNEMNEYDKKLLQDDGFRVNLRDRPKHPHDDYIGFKAPPAKEWVISW